MKCIALASALMLAAVTQSYAFAATQTSHEPELWRSYTGVSWDLGTEHKIDIVSHQAPISNSSIEGDSGPVTTLSAELQHTGQLKVG